MKNPHWVEKSELPEAEKARARFTLALRHAALHHNEKGSYRGLAKALGCREQVFYYAEKRGKLTASMAIALEMLVGRENAPREILCSDLIGE
jgi:hypothetical protein